MAVNMLLLLLLLLTAVTQAVVAVADSTLTTDQLHTVLCVGTVAHRHFAPGRPLVLSLPRTNPNVARRTLSEPLSQRDDLQTVNVILGKLHQGTRWPIELFRPSGDDTAGTSVLHHSYILFCVERRGGQLKRDAAKTGGESERQHILEPSRKVSCGGN